MPEPTNQDIATQAQLYIQQLDDIMQILDLKRPIELLVHSGCTVTSESFEKAFKNSSACAGAIARLTALDCKFVFSPSTRLAAKDALNNIKKELAGVQSKAEQGTLNITDWPEAMDKYDKFWGGKANNPITHLREFADGKRKASKPVKAQTPSRTSLVGKDRGARRPSRPLPTRPQSTIPDKLPSTPVSSTKASREDAEKAYALLACIGDEIMLTTPPNQKEGFKNWQDTAFNDPGVKAHIQNVWEIVRKVKQNIQHRDGLMYYGPLRQVGNAGQNHEKQQAQENAIAQYFREKHQIEIPEQLLIHIRTQYLKNGQQDIDIGEFDYPSDSYNQKFPQDFNTLKAAIAQDLGVDAVNRIKAAHNIPVKAKEQADIVSRHIVDAYHNAVERILLERIADLNKKISGPNLIKKSTREKYRDATQKILKAFQKERQTAITPIDLDNFVRDLQGGRKHTNIIDDPQSFRESTGRYSKGVDKDSDSAFAKLIDEANALYNKQKFSTTTIIEPESKRKASMKGG